MEYIFQVLSLWWTILTTDWYSVYVSAVSLFSQWTSWHIHAVSPHYRAPPTGSESQTRRKSAAVREWVSDAQLSNTSRHTHTHTHTHWSLDATVHTELESQVYVYIEYRGGVTFRPASGWKLSSSSFHRELSVSHTSSTLQNCFRLFMARQHAYAWWARYCCDKSVRPSVRHNVVLYRNECKYRQTLSTVCYGHGSIVFECCWRYKIPRGISLAGAYRRLSRKRYEIHLRPNGLTNDNVCYGTVAHVRECFL